MKFSRVFTFCLFIIGVALAPTAQAQTTPVTILEARAGLGGICKPGMWLPIHVVVENKGADFEARIQAEYQDSNVGEALHAADISLPSGARKQISLRLHPNGTIRNLTIRVMAGQKERAIQKLNIQCESEQFFLALWTDEAPTPYNQLNNVQALNQKTVFTQIQADELPEDARSWETLDALVIANADTSRLSEAQAQAMRQWVARGGKLFVTGGANWQITSAGLSELLPLKIQSAQSGGLEALSTYAPKASPLEGNAALASGVLLADAQILAGEESLPLLIERKIGYGSVYFFAADPAMQPLRNWDGMLPIYQSLLGFRANQPTWSNLQWDSYEFNYAIAAISELSLPSFFYIFCWLGAYILAVGPLNFLVLRWIKRPELSWVTIPALVILFTGTAYFFGILYRGGTPVLHRLTLTQGWQGVPQAKAQTMIGAYSPNRTDYDIQSSEDFVLYATPSLNSLNLKSAEDWLLVESAHGSKLPGARFDIGSMNTMAAEGELPALEIQSDLQISLTDTLPTLRGSITNGERGLESAALLLPGGQVALGNLAPHQTIQIREVLYAPTAAVWDIYSFITNAGLQAYPVSGDKEAQRRSHFLQGCLTNSHGNLSIFPEIYLVGWAKDPRVPVEIAGQNSKDLDLMLHVHQFTPRVVQPSAPFQLPSSLFAWESSIQSIQSYLLPSDGSYELRFRPALPVKFKEVQRLDLDIQFNTNNVTVNLFLWDFSASAWEEIPALQGNVSDPARFVGVGGELRMKMQSNPNDYVGINAVNFTLKVAP